MPINKRIATFDQAVADIPDGAVLHIGGFGGPAGWPSYLIAALARKGVRGLTVIGNNTGWGLGRGEQVRRHYATVMAFPPDFYDAGLLVERGQVSKGILTFAGSSSVSLEFPFEKLLREGKVELELIGQGSLSERIRAARAGIAAFYTPVGPGTAVAEGKEVRDFDGVPHVLERALKADFALIRAHRADRLGNLVYRGTGRTINATMAGAASVTIAEVDDIVEAGGLDPEIIVTPGVYVQRLVVVPNPPRAWDAPS